VDNSGIFSQEELDKSLDAGQRRLHAPVGRCSGTSVKELILDDWRLLDVVVDPVESDTSGDVLTQYSASSTSRSSVSSLKKRKIPTAQPKKPRCSICRQLGHNRRKCPSRHLKPAPGKSFPNRTPSNQGLTQ